MRVVLVCPYAWDRFGGVQSHIRALAAALRARSHRVAVIAPRSMRQQGRPSGAVSATPNGHTEGFGGITYVGRTVSVPANGSMAPLTFGPVAARGVRRALRELRPDVVHLHEPLIPSVSLLALWNGAHPTVGTFHAAGEGSAGYWASRRMLGAAAERLTLRTAVSPSAQGLIQRYFPGEYLITPNGVEAGRFASAVPLDLGASKSVLFLGRIERRKGLEVLVQAMTRLRDLDVTLVVAGDGPERRRCSALARRLGVRARFLGPVHDDVKPALFAAADVYCAPNLGGESFGIVLLEAMAAGSPVVCSDLPGFRDVAGDAGLLVGRNNPGALADALHAALDNEERAGRMSKASLGVAERFDWQRLSGEVERVYETAVAESLAP